MDPNAITIVIGVALIVPMIRWIASNDRAKPGRHQNKVEY